jgi:chromosome segregation ATPase
MHNLTTQEQERLAYAEGYTETAAVLARLDDAHAALGDEVAMQAQLDDLQAERDGLRDELALERAAYAGLQAELDDATDERDDALGALDPLGCKLHDTRAELELATDKLKTYRSALMAIEAEVPAHVRQFIREVLE